MFSIVFSLIAAETRPRDDLGCPLFFLLGEAVFSFECESDSEFLIHEHSILTLDLNACDEMQAFKCE